MSEMEDKLFFVESIVMNSNSVFRISGFYNVDLAHRIEKYYCCFSFIVEDDALKSRLEAWNSDSWIGLWTNTEDLTFLYEYIIYGETIKKIKSGILSGTPKISRIASTKEVDDNMWNCL